MVSVVRADGGYPQAPPFHPHAAYPEYRLGALSGEPNAVYEAVRNAFRLLGFDQARYGTADWNPLGHIVRPGDSVFVKPNLVDHEHRYGGDLWSVITHPAVVRAVVDYLAIALRGEGKIVIGDNPHADADFRRLLDATALDKIARLHAAAGLETEVADLRFWTCDDLRYYGFRSRRKALGGDPIGEVLLNLGERSKLHGVSPALLRGTYSKRWETMRHHHGRRQEYSFSKSILDADVYVSIPKLKAHCKVGATLNVKGLVGTIANKNTLVHWRIGFPALGGDEYPNPPVWSDYPKLYLQHLFSDLVPEPLYLSVRDAFRGTAVARAWQRWLSTGDQRQKVLRGAWDGNDSIWRMTVDIYNLFVCDQAGYRQSRGKPFRGLSVVDGIVGGAANGPHFPERVEAGVVLAGEDLLAVDVAACRLMDFDPQAVPYLDALLRECARAPEEIAVASDCFDGANFFERGRRYLGFTAPYRWPRLSLHGHCAETNRCAHHRKGEVEHENHHPCGR